MGERLATTMLSATRVEREETRSIRYRSLRGVPREVLAAIRHRPVRCPRRRRSGRVDRRIATAEITEFHPPPVWSPRVQEFDPGPRSHILTDSHRCRILRRFARYVGISIPCYDGTFRVTSVKRGCTDDRPPRDGSPSKPPYRPDDAALDSATTESIIRWNAPVRQHERVNRT